MSDDDLLIVLLRVNNQPVAPAFEIYLLGETVLLPVNAFNELMELNWQLDNASKTLAFSPDSNSDFCAFKTKLTTTGPAGAYFWGQDDFDLYIEATALQAILGAEYQFDFELQQLSIDTDLVFPSQQKPINFFIPSFVAAEEVRPDRVVTDNYHLFSSPLVNYRLTSNFDSSTGNTNGSLVVNSFFDLFHHSTQLRINQNNDISSRFLRFSKNLGVSEQSNQSDVVRYEFGDIQLQSDELLFRAKQAAGFQIYNFNPNFSRNFSTVTIEEITLPGWRAQLFRNGEFIEEVFSNSDNRVVFENVDTFYGNNVFEIKLYGPEGQQDVRQQSVNIGQDQLAKGKFNYFFSASDAGIRSIDSNPDEQAYDRQVSAIATYGLTENATIEIGGHATSGLSVDQNYLTSSLIFNLDRAAIKLQGVKDLDNGSGFFAGVRTDLGNLLKVNFSGRYFDDLSTDLFPERRDLKSDVRLRINGRMPFNSGITWNSNITHRSFNEDEDDEIISLNFNSNLLGGTFSSGLAFNNGIDDETFRHRLYWSKNFSGWQLSSNLEWLPSDNQKVVNYYSNLRWPQKYGTFNETRIEYQPFRENKLLLRHLLNWRKDEFTMQFGATVDDGGDWSVNFGITGDLEFNPYNNSIDFYRPRGNNTSHIRAFAFLDNNRNAVFDEPDERLSDVQISGSQSWRTQRTNDRGYIQLATNQRQQSVKIEEATLPDPFMQPADSLVYVYSHAGGVNTVSLPVLTFSDIEGAIYRVNNSNSRGVGGIEVALIDNTGNTVAKTLTEFDGFFLFTRIPPGDFQLRVEPTYLSENGLTIANLPQVVNAPSEGDAVRINDLLLVNQVDSSTETIAQTESPIEDLGSQAFVQIGVFRKPSSIIEVVKHLPTENYDLNIFRHHARGLSYVALGGFNARANAENALGHIKQATQFADAFIANGKDFIGPQWSLEYKLSNIAPTLKQSEEEVFKLGSGQTYCQLASYRSLSSINIPTEPLSEGKVFVVKRLVDQTRYYTFVAGPYASPQQCASDELNRLTPETPFAVAAEVLQQQIVKDEE